MNTYVLLASLAGNFAGYLSNKFDTKNIRTIFITTAANPYAEKPWMESDIKSFEEVGFEVKKVDIAQMTQREIVLLMSETDLCIVGGGTTTYLLEEMLKKNILEDLKRRVSEGMMYVGSSAGSVIASPDISLERHFEDRKNPPRLDSYEGLNLCNFHILPHWGREKYLEEYVKVFPHIYEEKSPLITLNDHQAVEILNGKLEILDLSDT